MTLHGRTILLTRQPEQAEEILGEIEARGGRALLFPTIEIVPPESWLGCDHALDHLGGYDGFIFTSVNAVSGFLERAIQRGVGPAVIGPRPVWAVGERTAKELIARGVAPEALPETFTGSSVAQQIRALAQPPRRLLLPQGELAGDALARELSAGGITVETVVVYRTVPASGRDPGEIRSKLSAGEIDVVAFFSPSAARNFAALFVREALSAVLSRSIVAVIGPTTGNALRELGVEPTVVAERSTARGIIDAIDQHFAGSS